MQVIYAFQGNESDDLKINQRFLGHSMENMYNLYLLILSLLVEIQAKAEDHLIKSQKKHLATQEEKNPNRKFVNNELLLLLKENTLLKETLESRKVTNWKLDDEYIDVLFKSLIESDLYKEYMSTKTSTFKEDKSFIIDVFKEIIAPNDKLYNYLEDKNITWLDDLPVINTAIVKLLRKANPNISQSHFLPQLFKDEDDRVFANNLLNKTLLNLTALSKEIEGKTANWDKDRIANIDFVLLQMAICEFQKFSSIPVKVTINEYLEIAKEYSTPKSSVFINGILDKLVKEYSDKGTLNKVGRGLI
ncbi:transcription antitermination factor NusB [Pontimicrobium aquaticum]|uniref:Transcription antitermination factor NusB n=2 Tax=Pontimicrobium aquaticum TaxID=2565367 RepID=A0A4U0EMY8_9FLAO|nr:transcription antitermination factor NusB [Pontimicrobium aquaticum]